MKAIPSVAKFMTTTPHFIGSDESITTAHKLMSEYEIRHLPVLDGGKLAGLVTARDLAVMESISGFDRSKVTVEDVMNRNVYIVDPDAPMDEVCERMADMKYGSALVVQNARVVGILTTVDVCRAVATLLATRLKH